MFKVVNWKRPKISRYYHNNLRTETGLCETNI